MYSVYVCCASVCVRVRAHQPGSQKVPGLMPGYANLVCCFLEQETLFTLFQSTQLYIGAWGSSCNINEYPVFTGETNIQLSLSRLVVLGLLWNFGFCDLFVRLPVGY